MVTPGVSGAPQRRLRWIAVGQMVLWGAIGLGAFLLLAKSVQNSPEFGRLQIWILAFDICGVIALSVLLARKLWRLVRDYRAHVPGSRLTARTVAIFGALVIAPLLIVYLSSLEFINQGIDSWFKVEVKRGLSDAVDLSRAALELRTREYAGRTLALAAGLTRASPADVQTRLDSERRESQALEVVLFSAHGRVIGASLENPLENLPSPPPADLVRQVEAHLPYVSLEPQTGGHYLIRTAAALGGPGSHDERFVVVTYPLPAQLAALSEAVQNSYSQYGDLAALREPLKYSFRLTLTLVLLLSMLAAIYGAIYSAQRLVRPVQDLIEGTRAVGKGDFGTRLPLPSRDEMGFLVHSFNDMTKKLRRARSEATQSQQAVERERERLAIILARLSTGVLAIDRNMVVRNANAAAGAILGTDLSAAAGRALPELAASNERLGQFLAALAVRFAAGREEWREQLDLDGATGRRTLMCACTPLPGEDADVGFVIVFDDITTLLQAQRDAAWGEVARRLAHEIKNPLTPIQLSAERLAVKLAGKLDLPEEEALTRGTQTIIAQVTAMKQMVDDFAIYARQPRPGQMQPVDLNALLLDVLGLYENLRPRVSVKLAERAAVIHGEPTRLRQVFHNLIQNAVDAQADFADPAYEFTVEHHGRELALSLADRGSGFPEDMMRRAFEPYVTTKAKGTGLGLAIVKKIVEEHHGRVTIENRHPHGALVTLYFPLEGTKT